jgi:hypothetical protein
LPICEPPTNHHDATRSSLSDSSQIKARRRTFSFHPRLQPWAASQSPPVTFRDSDGGAIAVFDWAQSGWQCLRRLANMRWKSYSMGKGRNKNRQWTRCRNTQNKAVARTRILSNNKMSSVCAVSSRDAYIDEFTFIYLLFKILRAPLERGREVHARELRGACDPLKF